MIFPPVFSAAPFPLLAIAALVSTVCFFVHTFHGVADAQAGLRPAKGSEVTDEVNEMSERATHRALTERTADQARLLLDRGARIDARNSEGETALITAARRGNLALLTVLINRGARIDTADHEGNTALHEASFQSEASCVEALLIAGAPLSGRNALGFTPLHQAVRRFWEIAGESTHDRLARQAGVIRLLLRYGADPLLLDGNGRTPAVLAVQSTNGILQQAFPPPARLAPLQAMPGLSPASKPTQSHPAVTSSTDQRPAPADRPVNPREHEPGSTPPLVASPSDTTSPPPETASTAFSSPARPASALTGTESEPQSAASAFTGKGAASQDPSAALTPMETVPSDEIPPPAAEPVSQPPISSPRVADRPLPRPSEAASPPPSVDRQEQPRKEERRQTTPTNPTDHTQTSEAGTRQPVPPQSPTPSASSLSPPDAAAHAEIPVKTAPAQTSSTADDVRQADQSSAGLSHEPNPAPSFTRPTTPSVSAPPQLSPTAAAEPTKPVAKSTPAIGGGSQSGDRPAGLRTSAHRNPGLFHNVGFGLGLGWTHNLGPRRVDSVTVVNGVVRIDNEQNDFVRFMPEVHVWLDRWDEQRWSWGPFLAVAPGTRVIDAIGFGFMIGYRPHQADQYSFNLGIGGTLDLDARVLGDGLVANEPLPAGETTARTKQTTAAGLLIMFSVGWDLAAPYRTVENDSPK